MSGSTPDCVGRECFLWVWFVEPCDLGRLLVYDTIAPVRTNLGLVECNGFHSVLASHPVLVGVGAVWV